MRFNGFISYSHAADGRLAPAVQRGLHQLAKPWHRRRALWVFRDQTGLSVTPGLWSSIQRALDGSDWFVLLASPEAARSSWVNREIEHWIAVKSADRILPVVTGGVWRWDPAAADFSEDSTAVPAALRGVFSEEPLYLDLRWARHDLQLNLRHSRFRDAIAQLAAPMHGVNKDDLEGEDVRQHRRLRRLGLAAVASLTVLALVASMTGVFASRTADRANAAAAEARVQHQVAVEQRGSAQRFAEVARQQEGLALQQEARAKQAAAEAQRQEQLAGQQKGAAQRASGEVRRQQDNARRQRAIADAAAARAQEQERLARQQGAAARSSALETVRQKRIARDQQRLAEESAAVARRQQQIAEEQQRLAQLATAEARRQEQNAKDQQTLATAAAEEARKQKGDAEQQKRIAVGRRLVNKAKAVIDVDPTLALMLGVASQKIQADAEARTELAGLVTSTSYAGTVGAADDVATGRPGVLALRTFPGDVSLWNVADPTRPTRFATLRNDDGSAATTMAFSPDRLTLAVSYDDFSVILWNVTDPSRPAPSATLSMRGIVRSFAFGPDGRTLVMNDWSAADGDTESTTIAGLWDVTDIARPRRLSTLSAENVDFADRFAFSPDGRTVLSTALQVAPVTIWNVADRMDPVRLGVLDGGPTSILEFSPVAPILLTTSAGEVLRWDLTDPTSPGWTTTSIGQSAQDHPAFIVSVAFSSDGRTLASRDKQGRVRLWAMIDNLPVVAMHSVTGQAGYGPLAFDVDGRTLITTDRTTVAKLWRVRSYGEPQPVAVLTDHRDNTTAVSFSPDGRSMVTVDHGGTAIVWDMTRPAHPVRRAQVSVHDRRISSVAFSRDGRTVAAAGEGGRVTLTDITQPTRPVIRATFSERGAVVRELAFSPDGKTLAVALGSPDGPLSVALWDLTGPARPTRLTALPGARPQVTFSPDSRTLAAVHDDDAVKLWDLTNRSAPAERGTLAGHRNTVDVVAFGPDGETVATGSHDGTAILWDVTDRRRPLRLATLPGHAWQVASAVFSADGRTLVTTSYKDERAIVWDIADRVDPVRVSTFALNGSEARPFVDTRSLVLSPDGRTMALAGAPHPVVTVWDTGELNGLRANPARQACAVTGRGLDTEEWVRHIPDLRYRSTCPGLPRR